MLEQNGYQFIEETKYPNISESDQRLGKPQPPYEIPLEKDAPLIDLPDPASIDFGQYDCRKAIEERRSLRRYQDDQLSLEELSYLLWLTQGVKKEDEKRHVVWRTVPSAGCRHPFETYLSINRVEGLQPGVYRFVATQHKLVTLDISDTFNEQLTDVCLGQRQVATSAVTFIWAAVPYRTIGAIQSAAIVISTWMPGMCVRTFTWRLKPSTCGICTIGAYDDDAADQLLGFNPPEMFVIYMASLGRRNLFALK